MNPIIDNGDGTGSYTAKNGRRWELVLAPCNLPTCPCLGLMPLWLAMLPGECQYLLPPTYVPGGIPGAREHYASRHIDPVYDRIDHRRNRNYYVPLGQVIEDYEAYLLTLDPGDESRLVRVER
jgi:hypothetical protein